MERQRKAASDAHAARVDSDKALASTQAKMSAFELSMQAKVDEVEQSRSVTTDCIHTISLPEQCPAFDGLIALHAYHHTSPSLTVLVTL